MTTTQKQDKSPEMVSWEQIGKCFHQHLSGNGFNENMSTVELEGMMHIFKAGWIFQQTFCKGMVSKYD